MSLCRLARIPAGKGNWPSKGLQLDSSSENPSGAFGGLGVSQLEDICFMVLDHCLSGFLDMLVAKRSGAGARGLRGRGDRRVCGLPFGAEGSTSRDENGATHFFAQRNHMSLFHVGE